MSKGEITIDTNVLEHVFNTQINADGHVDALLRCLVEKRVALCHDDKHRISNNLQISFTILRLVFASWSITFSIVFSVQLRPTLLTNEIDTCTKLPSTSITSEYQRFRTCHSHLLDGVFHSELPTSLLEEKLQIENSTFLFTKRKVTEEQTKREIAESFCHGFGFLGGRT